MEGGQVTRLGEDPAGELKVLSDDGRLFKIMAR